MTKRRHSHTAGPGCYDKGEPLATRVRNRTLVDPSPGACWLWIGSIDKPVPGKKLGYGRLSHERKMLMAHRASWEAHNGPVPNEMCILHRCDNPRCVNPEHLFIGTVTDNNADRHQKNRDGRTMGRPGASHPAAKISEETVLCIRALIDSGERLFRIAEQFGLSISHVSAIKHRKTWSHI